MDEIIEKEQKIVQKSKKNSNKLIKLLSIFAICILVYTVASGFIVKILLKSGQERLAVKCYNTQIYRGFIDKKIIDKHIDNICYDYFEDSGNDDAKSEEQKFNTVKSKLKTMAGIKNMSLSNKAKSEFKQIEINYFGWKSLDLAEEKFEKEQFLEAIVELKKIDKKFVQYDAVQDLLYDSKTQLFTSVECPNSDAEYEAAIVLMNKCYKSLKESEYSERAISLEQEYIEYQAVEEYIANAEKFIKEQNYIQAVSCLKDISEKYPKEKHLMSAKEDTNNILLFTTIEKVKELSEKKQYDEALKEIDAAKLVYPCEVFDELYREIESKSSKLLWLKNKVIDFKDSIVASFQKDVEEVKKEGGLSYIEKSGKKIVLGDYSKENVNVLSCVGDGALALAGLDTPQDIRDLTYDIQHIGEEDDWVVRLAVDTVAVIPVIGTVKYLKYLKQTGKASNVADSISDGVKVADKVSDAAKTIDKSGTLTKESSKLLDKLKDTKLGNLVAEKKAMRSYREIKTRNQDLCGKYHKDAKVKFYSRKLIYKNGYRIRGVFPKFDALFRCKLPDNLLKENNNSQFKECVKQLQKQIKRKPWLKRKFSKETLVHIEAGKSRISGWTWHHNEKEGIMELVDAKIHKKVGHTGGRELWGGGAEARK